MPEILIGKNLALESLMRAPLSPASRMIAELAIDSVPVVNAEPVRLGRWEIITTDANVWKCTTCGDEWMLNDGNPSDNNMLFCPHCGARMDGGADNGKET